jgi:hypothetical protein
VFSVHIPRGVETDVQNCPETDFFLTCTIRLQLIYWRPPNVSIRDKMVPRVDRRDTNNPLRFQHSSITGKPGCSWSSNLWMTGCSGGTQYILGQIVVRVNSPASLLLKGPVVQTRFISHHPSTTLGLRIPRPRLGVDMTQNPLTHVINQKHNTQYRNCQYCSCDCCNFLQETCDENVPGLVYLRLL